ncbi:hypothetical protein AMS68_001359 [Peltaster fructicola]|uniref:SWIRM domain-containing protein n=1 Tax=Peltaster fructicola TaxID=286661 RepID=A0A6H0XM59_9PEZI|nr:hypothetical protein AMS68_001359 [Peltaster fructicola]
MATTTPRRADGKRYGHVPISVEATTQSQADSAVMTEDASSMSPSSPDLFDRPDPYTKDDNTNWQRYGSLESATSTGITSLSSSISTDDSHMDVSAKINHSRKRTIDGKLKVASPKSASHLSSKPSPSTNNSKQSIESIAAHNLTKAGPAPLSAPRPRSDTSTYRPRSSIPSSLSATIYAGQCIEAALASRLDPYALHRGEHDLLVDAITTSEVTVYLNIRNAILRLWLRNPICSVTLEEAAGCAKESRFFGLAEVAFNWLTRNGYINFGCIDIPRDSKAAAKVKKMPRQRTVVVIGAGVAGLTTARQLENQFAHDQEHWQARGEKVPKVIIIEGRKRIGGRVYSKPLRTQSSQRLPGGTRNTAEMGAMIVTGFERGNPLDIIIRAQLGLPYHLLKDALTIYDCDGKPVDEKRDLLNTDLYTDISDRTGEFRAAPRQQHTLRGDEDLINRGRDPAQRGLAESQLEPLETFDPSKQRKPISKRGRRTNAPPGTEKLTGRSEIVEGGNASIRAATAAHQMGWRVKDGVSKNHTVSLHAIAESYHHPSLGTVMDAAIKQYQTLLDIQPRDMRLLNWHHANLEYANAAPVTRLSLSGHDQDNGNEFEGAHSEIIGGYTQMPRGLMNLPTKLDVRFDHTVESIHYDDRMNDDHTTTTKIVCTNGKVIEADEVILTAPLGVLKSDMIDFDPPLPDWKQGAIERMGFGLLNKVVLVYDAPFWDESRDMFGLLNEPEEKDSLDPQDYEARRGRFYLIWNASRISGRPMLMALMAGHAAQQAETTDTASLLCEITERLRKVFTLDVPAPREVIVTRWRHDPYARGTYSYVAQKTQGNDYNLMAKSVGNLHFAGEATCGTHPATVHGAFLSGLRAAADVMDTMMGPIELPMPLVGPPTVKEEASPVKVIRRPQPAVEPPAMLTTSTSTANIPIIKAETETVALATIPWATTRKLSGPPSKSVCSSDPSFWVSADWNNNSDIYEATVASVIFAQVGERPIKPARSGVNPFLLYSKAKWDECKTVCAEKGTTNTGHNAIRQVLGQWWKDLSDEAKQPYLDQSKAAQDTAEADRKGWTTAVAKWDEDAKRIRQEYMNANPPARGTSNGSMDDNASGRRKTNVSTNIALDFSFA